MTLYPLSYVLQQHTLPPLSPASWCVDSDCTNVNSFNKEHFSVFLDQILFAQCYLLDTYSNTLGRNPVLCCNLYRRRRKVKCFFSMDTQSWAQHWKASAWGVPGKSLNEVCRVEGITGGVVLVHFAFFFFHIYIIDSYWAGYHYSIAISQMEHFGLNALCTHALQWLWLCALKTVD